MPFFPTTNVCRFYKSGINVPGCVKEYVIVDRFAHRVTVLTLEEGTYSERVLGPDDVYASPRLPGLEIPLGGVI